MATDKQQASKEASKHGRRARVKSMLNKESWKLDTVPSCSIKADAVAGQELYDIASQW